MDSNRSSQDLHQDLHLDSLNRYMYSTRSNLKTKRKFINTADAMIHARGIGESFGMACAEYSFCNKPVITFDGSPERNHIATLKDKGVYYSNGMQLVNIFKDFRKEPQKDWNAYKDFSPEKVMAKFDQVFLNQL